MNCPNCGSVEVFRNGNLCVAWECKSKDFPSSSLRTMPFHQSDLCRALTEAKRLKEERDQWRKVATEAVRIIDTDANAPLEEWATEEEIDAVVKEFNQLAHETDATAPLEDWATVAGIDAVIKEFNWLGVETDSATKKEERPSDKQRILTLIDEAITRSYSEHEHYANGVLRSIRDRIWGMK